MTAVVGASSDGHTDVNYSSLLVNTLAIVDNVTTLVAIVWTSNDGHCNISHPSLIVHIVAMMR
jgi:hypothetical protein